MEIDMRHTKLKAEEAAILAGELEKPGWASRNEGIHERVSFEDTIWGFDLAGGSYYKTPLRVTYVKAGSRAEKAGIRPGDRLKRINDIDSSTLTIQEAHEIIVESGIHLKLAVTAPEDEEDAYYCYEDELQQQGYDSDEERRREEERARKRQVHARVSHYWSLQWPWVSKRRIIYRESNCFMVPSKFEEKNKAKFPTQPMLKTQEDIILDSINSDLEKNRHKTSSTISNGNIVANGLDNKTTTNGLNLINNDKTFVNSTSKATKSNGMQEVSEVEDPSTEDDLSSMREDFTETEEVTQSVEVIESKEEISHNEISREDFTETEEVTQSEEVIESKEEISHNEISVDESYVENVSENDESKQVETSEEIVSSHNGVDDMIEQILEGDESIFKTEEEDVIESILSDTEEHNMTSTTDER